MRRPAPMSSMNAISTAVAPNSPSSSPIAAKMKSVLTAGILSGRRGRGRCPLTPPSASANIDWTIW